MSWVFELVQQRSIFPQTATSLDWNGAQTCCQIISLSVCIRSFPAELYSFLFKFEICTYMLDCAPLVFSHSSSSASLWLPRFSFCKNANGCHCMLRAILYALCSDVQLYSFIFPSDSTGHNPYVSAYLPLAYSLPAPHLARSRRETRKDMKYYRLDTWKWEKKPCKCSAACR